MSVKRKSIKQMNNFEKKNRITLILFTAAVFTIMFVFYSRIHPLVIYDADDWKYICFTRHAFPVWKEWNPTRVLPEIMMSLTAEIGTFCIYPFTKDFINANIIINAIVVSIFITIYIYTFYRVIEKRYGMSQAANIFVSALFLILHFWIFRYKSKSNEYMFNGLDLTCFFYYIIPNMINASIVMRLSENDIFEMDRKTLFEHPIRNGTMFTVIYLALVSNLYASVILAGYVGCRLILEIITGLKKKEELSDIMKKNIPRILLIVFWLVIQIFELNGGRADDIKTETSLIGLCGQQVFEFVDLGGTLSPSFVTLYMIICILFIIVLVKGCISKTNHYIEDVKRVLFDIAVSIVVLIYLIMVSSVHYIGSIKRPDILFGFVFFIFLMLMTMLLSLMREIKVVKLVLPLVVLISFFEINTPKRTFKETNIRNINYQKCIAIDNDIIDQIVTAGEKNKKDITVYVPSFKAESNWPLSVKTGDLAATALYKHGITDHKVKVKKTKPTRKKNKKFGLK